MSASLEKIVALEATALKEVCSLPAQMQKIYLQLLSAIDCSLLKLRSCGAEPDHLSEAFIEEVVDQLLDKSLSERALQRRINEEFQRKILEHSELEPVC